ncbi:glycoside hydrolase family 31 protein [Stereum hirsutum FP-91666 SS1]|uniref:glycoside hydrolase family 31 protein n=1 Tax=Stereum hirsutum (strain FP-91666) TaxID=721885 RepID=UPI0004449E3E|nr:glycoside hydrolase family 31 protein [Stereum hirsutum FP-91666 SS1]EIM80725.1 glycoside hydrolase family 31 protein [Stereum hirsutum FP-91666 SS1]
MKGLTFSSVSFLLLFTLFSQSLAVKHNDFKTCSQSGFCRRGRALAERANTTPRWQSPYSLDPSSISVSSSQASFTAGIKSSLYPDIKFGLDVRVQEDGVVRVRMDEIDGLRKRYDEAAGWALIAEPLVNQDITWTVGKKDVRATYGPKKDIEVVVEFQPLRVVLKRGGKEQVVVNGRGLLHMEHFRTKSEAKEIKEGEEAQEPMQVNSLAWFEGDSEDGYWEESFGSHKDSKPKGPESLSVDIEFPNHGHVYGIPQHATSLSLPTTTGDDPFYSDPFRLYNADVFEYLASSPMSLYGSIPLMHAHSADSTVGVFHVVASETWIDISHPTTKSTNTHWISESGILDLFLLPGPTPEAVFKQYATLTGTAPLPAHWALAYHQCRWNYVSSDDVRTVAKRFDEEDMPVDVFWLDIEYAEEHKYFIWDKKTFPDPIEMTNDVAAVGRKMVAIIDPHLKRTSNYPVYEQAKELDVLVKKSDNNEYEGWCWTGSSSWVDFFNPASWSWWASLFKMQEGKTWSWTQSTEDIYVWNDMNEPAIFNGPEITMPKDNVHYGGWEHRDVHNINGMLFPNVTSQGLIARSDPPKRPFVLTRSFYAGSQRFGAMWTGDNMGTWEHMAVGIKMVLANSIAGMSFAGSDVGGFFGNPESEMLVRWYQWGIFSPFFRAHAHIDTKRREPYLLDEPYKSMLRDILRLRYSMLPVWYTAFRETSATGLPVLRPQYVMFPQDTNGFAIDDQFYVGGSGLLVKPVTSPGAKDASVYLAENQVYYDYFSHKAYRGSSKGKSVTVPAELHQVPVLIRGGSVIPTRERPRRSSPLMKNDPFTLRVALGSASSARGELYLDDGVTFSHEKGDVVFREFTAGKAGKGIRISSTDLAAAHPGDVALSTYDKQNDFVKSIEKVKVEKIVVLGLGVKPSSVKIEGGEQLEFEFVEGVAADGKKEGVASVLTIKNPGVLITKDWEIVVA